MSKTQQYFSLLTDKEFSIHTADYYTPSGLSLLDPLLAVEGKTQEKIPYVNYQCLRTLGVRL